MFRAFIATLMLVFVSGAYGAQSQTDFQRQMLEQIQMLTAQVGGLQQELQQVKQAQQASQAENDSLKQQIADLQQSGSSGFAAVTHESLDSDSVDLSHQRQAQVQGSGSHVLSNPWWQNVEIWGFAAAGYYDTGSGGTRDHGSFEIKEATLFVEADVWEDTSFFLELQTNRLGADESKFVRTGEVYIHWRDLQVTNNTALGLKVGRIDIPFGEEYLWQDAVDNPLITNSTSYPYGWDEGVLLYGETSGVNWIAAITDGTDARSEDDNSDKAYNLKLYGNVTENFYLSGSYMHNGDNVKSAVEFAGSHFEPVDGSGSEQVSSDLWQIDARYDFKIADMPAYIALVAGMADQSDDDSVFDRDFRWFSVEPFLQVNPEWYAVVRYSEIGTYDNDEGYHFDGKTFAGGNSTFGYDVERFRRLGVGIGWQPNPRVTTKLEIGKDWFDLIDGSAIEVDDDRNFVGLEMAVGF